jgi:cytidylate kinase
MGRVPASPLLVLVGPAAAGKTTLGARVADRLGVPFVDVDAAADPWYAEVGWSVERLAARATEVGRLAAEREWEPARVHALERAVAAHPGAVVAAGAGHTSVTRADLADRVRAVLAPVRHVVLVLPSPDRAASLAELRRRCVVAKGRDWVVEGHDLLTEWLDDPTTRAVATAVLHTAGDDPATSTARLHARVSA